MKRYTLEFTNEKRPAYGVPVLIQIKGVVQHITYMLDGCDDAEDWFEPYHFPHDDDLKISCRRVHGWAELPGQ